MSISLGRPWSSDVRDGDRREPFLERLDAHPHFRRVLHALIMRLHLAGDLGRRAIVSR